ncbi:hypothetical protein V5O39_14595 [Pseudomonas parakoreensis]
MAELEKKSSSNRSSPNEDFEEILNIIKAIDIKIPANINKGEESTSDLFSIFANNRDTIIAGVTNSAAGSDLEAFLLQHMSETTDTRTRRERESGWRSIPEIRYY